MTVTVVGLSSRLKICSVIFSWDLGSEEHLDGMIFSALLAHTWDTESACGSVVKLAAVKGAVPWQWLC